MKQKKFLVLAVAAVAVFVLSGCSWQSAKTSLLAQSGDGTDEFVCPTVVCPPDCTAGCTQDANGCTTGVCIEVAPVCGDNICDDSETADGCPADCSADILPECGNGFCEKEWETPETCPKDCTTGTAVCGNGLCESGESQSNCEKDCGPPAVCGNGVCESGEDASNCSQDCGEQEGEIGRFQERRDMDNSLRDKERELKDMTRNLEECRSDVQGIDYSLQDKVLADWSATLQGMRDVLSTQPVDGLYHDFDSWLFWESNSHIDEIRNDFWNNMEQCNQGRRVSEFQNNIQNREREFKDIDKQASDIKRAGVVFEGTGAERKIKECKDLIAKAKTLVEQKNISELDYMWSDVDWCFRDIYDELNILHEQRQEVEQERNKAEDLKNIARVLKDKERMINKDMGRDLEKQKKEGIANEEAIACVDKLKGLLANMKSAYDAGNTGEAWDANQEIDWEQQDCWELIQKSWQAQEFTNRVRDRLREIEDRNRELKKIGKELEKGGVSADIFDKATDIVAKMGSLVDKIREAAASGDYDEARQYDDWDFQDLREEWDRIQPQLHMLHEVKFIKRDLEGGLKEVQKLRERLAHLQDAGRTAPEQIKKCKDFVDGKAEIKIKEALSALEKGNFEWLEKNGRTLESLQYEGERVCGFALEGRGGFGGADLEGFVKDDFEGMQKDLMQQVLERVTEDVMHKVMERVMVMSSNLIDQLVAKASEKFQEHIAKALEATSFVPQQYQNELIEKKTEILGQVEELEKLRDKNTALRAEIDDLEEKLAGYNFTGSNADAVKNNVAAFVKSADSMSSAELKTQLAQLKSETESAIEGNREDKYAKQIIPFKDTDDNVWFTKYVVVVKGSGAIRGYYNSDGTSTGEFRPGNELTKLEWTKIALELFGHKDLSWPDGYWNKAKELGVTLAVSGADMHSQVTRAEMLQLLFEIAGEKPGETGECAFSDTCGHQLKNYIEAAAEHGIVSGNPDGTFAPDRYLNRAEASKIASKVSEALAEQQKGE